MSDSRHSYSGLLRLRNPAIRSSGWFWVTVTLSTPMSAVSSSDGILESLSLPTSSSPSVGLFSSSPSDSGLSSRWSCGCVSACVCDSTWVSGSVSTAAKVSMSLSRFRSHVGSKRNNHMMCNTQHHNAKTHAYKYNSISSHLKMCECHSTVYENTKASVT